jgi:hypothetical protein
MSPSNLLRGKAELGTRHPLPILNISEHLTRRKLQTKSNSPFGEFYLHI